MLCKYTKEPVGDGFVLRTGCGKALDLSYYSHTYCSRCGRKVTRSDYPALESLKAELAMLSNSGRSMSTFYITDTSIKKTLKELKIVLDIVRK